MLINDPRQLDRTREAPLLLGSPKIAASFVEVILYGERVRRSYDLLAWVVMPNHVHLILRPHERLPEAMRWMTTATAARANRDHGRRRIGHLIAG